MADTREIIKAVGKGIARGATYSWFGLLWLYDELILAFKTYPQVAFWVSLGLIITAVVF